MMARPELNQDALFEADAAFLASRQSGATDAESVAAAIATYLGTENSKELAMQHVKLMVCVFGNDQATAEAKLNELTHDNWWIHEVTHLDSGIVLFTLTKNADQQWGVYYTATGKAVEEPGPIRATLDIRAARALHDRLIALGVHPDPVRYVSPEALLPFSLTTSPCEGCVDLANVARRDT